MEVLIQYRVKPEKVEEQKAAIIEFVNNIKAMEDPDISYASYQLPDGVSFKHYASLADEEAKARLQSQDFFRKFADEIDARCDEGPSVTPLTRIAATWGGIKAYTKALLGMARLHRSVGI
jgi:hypothetical protein